MRDRPFRRIAVIGSPGAGKSTLARLIGDATGLPVIHLDKEHWRPGWTEPDPADWQSQLVSLAARPRWVIDGQYGASLRDRLSRADLVVFLDLPTGLCLWRVLRRIAVGHGRVRPDIADGCPERFDLGFLYWVATFRRRRRAEVIAALTDSNAVTVRLRTRREQSAFAAAIRSDGLTAAVDRAGMARFISA